MLLTAIFHGWPVEQYIMHKQAYRLPLDPYETQVMRSITYAGLLGSVVIPLTAVTFVDAFARYIL